MLLIICFKNDPFRDKLRISKISTMALIFCGQTQCSICNEILKEEDDVVMTTHFIADLNDPLWRFSDSGMHQSCFLDWEHRQEFIKRFNETRGNVIAGNGTFQQMEKDGSISVLSNKESLTKAEVVEQLIAESGLSFPLEYLYFLINHSDKVLDVEAGRFEIYPAEEVLQINEDLQVEEFLPEFFVIGGDGANKLLAFNTTESKSWKVYMVPMIVMSKEDAVVIADSFESFIQSEKAG